MNAESILRENYSEIETLASEYGVDFSKAQDCVDWSGHMGYVSPLEGKNKQKVKMSSRILGKTLIITFFTYKGNRSGSWKYTEKNGSKFKVSRKSLRKAAKSKRIREAEAGEKAAKNAEYIREYEESDNWVSTFPYLEEKGLEGLVRVKKLSDYRGDYLAIPVYGSDNLIKGIQRIYAEKDKDGKQKLFTPGAKTAGAFHVVGELSGAEKVYVCEGWADAVSINISTGCPTVWAISCSNLPKVTEWLLDSFDPAQIIVAADNDCWDNESGNAGIRVALGLSYYKNLKARKPVFSDVPEGETPKDFNDLFVLKGKDEVRSQLSGFFNENIVRAPDRAFEFHVSLFLEATGTKPGDVKKQLIKIVRAGIRRGFSEEIILEAVKTRVAPGDLHKIWEDSIKAAHGRVRYFHDIRVHKHPDVNHVPLSLTRQPHGGYLIDDMTAENLMLLEGIIVVKSPMASGKTERVIKEMLEKSDSGVYLAHRVSLVEEACLRLKIMSYKGAGKFDVLGTSKIGVCLNSLNHPNFEHGDYFVKNKKECVFIDEGSKVLDHLTGSTIKDHEGVTETFLTMIEESKRTVICDADASDHMIDLLKSQFPDKKIHVVMSDHAPMDHIKVDLTPSFHAGYQKMLDTLDSGKNVLVATDSREEVRKIKKKLQKKGVKVLAIHSGTRVLPEVEAWIKNPDAQSHKYQAVVFNSCVDSGVSITTNHFDETIGFFRGVVTPDSIKQMMGRCRQSRNWFLVCNPMIKTRYCDTEQQMYQALAAADCKVRWEKKSQKIAEVPGLTDFDKVKLSMTRRNVLLRQDYELTIRLMLEQDGYDVTVRIPEEDQQTALEKEMKGIGQELRQEWEDKLLETRAPDYTSYRKLKDAYAVSEDEHAEIVRYEMEKGLCVKEITPEDVHFWVKNGRRKDLAFEILMTDQDELHLFDTVETQTVRSLTLRRNLLARGYIIKKMFECLEIDRSTGKGTFNHVKARAFFSWLYENEKRKLFWNYFRMGSFLMQDLPGNPVRVINEALRNLGLDTEKLQVKEKRLKFNQITEASWNKMMRYLEARKKEGRNVAMIETKFNFDRVPVVSQTPELKQEMFEAQSEEIMSEYFCSTCAGDVPESLVQLDIFQCADCQKVFHPD